MGDQALNFANVFAFETDHSTSMARYSDLQVLIKDKGSGWSGEWTEYVSAVQETERRRIASELHDGLGQMLTILTIELGSAKTAAVHCTPLVPALGIALERAYASACQAVDELRRSVTNLYPSMLDDLGVVASISAILREAHEADPRLLVEADITVSDTEIPSELRIIVFRVVQEAVNNVLKHAEAQLLKVKFFYNSGYLSLSITDNGRGIAPKSMQEHRPCSGMSGMIRRVKASDGDIQIVSSRGTGTTIAAVWNTARFRH